MIFLKLFSRSTVFLLFYRAVYLEPSVHEPWHLKDVDQVQDIRIVALHTLTQNYRYLIILCFLVTKRWFLLFLHLTHLVDTIEKF